MATETLTLTDFLRARIAEDKATARGAEYDGRVFVPNGDAVILAKRMVAECDAKLRIVEEFDGLDFGETGMGAWEPYRSVMRNVLRHLAAVYADHPDYRAVWRP